MKTLIERLPYLFKGFPAKSISAEQRAILDEAITALRELEEKLKTAQAWDDIESQRNEQLQARIDILERARIEAAVKIIDEQKARIEELEFRNKFLEARQEAREDNIKRLNAALADALKILRTHSSYKDDVDRIEKARAGE